MRILFFILIASLSVSGQNFSSDDLLSDSTGRAFADKLFELAWKNYPQNKVFESRVTIAEENLFQTKWNWVNNLNLSYQYNPNISSEPTTSAMVPKFGIGVSVNVGSIFLSPSRVTQAREEQEIATANLETQKNYIKAEVIKRLAVYTRTLDLLKLNTEGTNDSESNLELAKKKFSNGEISLETLNLSYRAYNDSEAKRVASTADLLFNKAALEELIGGPLESVK